MPRQEIAETLKRFFIPSHGSLAVVDAASATHILSDGREYKSPLDLSMAIAHVFLIIVRYACEIDCALAVAFSIRGISQNEMVDKVISNVGPAAVIFGLTFLLQEAQRNSLLRDFRTIQNGFDRDAFKRRLRP